MPNIFLINDTSKPIVLDVETRGDYLAFSEEQRDMLETDIAREEAALVIQNSLASAPLDASNEERAWLILEDLEENVDVAALDDEGSCDCNCSCNANAPDDFDMIDQTEIEAALRPPFAEPIPICGDVAPFRRFTDDGQEHLFFCDLHPAHLGNHRHNEGDERIYWDDADA
jgi:hypothetical protein